MNYRMKVVSAVSLLFSLTFITTAQNQPLAFEVASIKPHVMTGSGSIGTRISGSLVTVSVATLKRLILEAYAVRDYQVSGGPSWMNGTADVYDITARAAGVQPTR